MRARDSGSSVHTLVAQSPTVLVLLWIVTLPFCAFAAWLFLFLAIRDAPVAAGLLAGSFLLIGVMLLLGTIELTLHYLRYDALHLTITGEPPAVGKRLDAIVDLPARVGGAWVGFELACVHLSHERIGPNRTAAFEKDRWSERRQFPVRRDGRRRSAAIRFDIPDSLPPSGSAPAAGPAASADRAREGFFWELRIGPGEAEPASRRALVVDVRPSASSDGHAGD